MLIKATTDPRVDQPSEGHWHQHERYVIGWKGNVYLPGFAAGTPTVAHLATRLAELGLDHFCAALRGVYGMFIYDGVEKTWHIFSDNGALYRIFYSSGTISTSFLELALAERSAAAVDSRSVLEFIAHGGNFGRHTPVSTIHKIRRHEILRLTVADSGAVEIVDKHLPATDASGDAFVLDYFSTFARSMANQRVSVDLTGGFDTRLIACLLGKMGLDFDCGVAGRPGSSDVRIAHQVAETLGRQLYPHEHDISTVATDLPAVFLTGDGLSEIPRLHRNRQLCLSRLARGIETMVHGGGGGLFQDHYYVHDFPRYGTKAFDLERLYRIRVMPVIIPDAHLTRSAAHTLADLRATTIANFEKCREETNNQTYERIFYELRMTEFYGVTFTNYINMGMGVEAPFLDYRMYHVATTMSPWSRTFMLWHRRTTTKHCPKLAALQTNLGYTASSQPWRVLMESGKYMRVQAGRVGRKLTERHLGKSLFHRVGALEADPPGYRQKLRESALFMRALERLKVADILAGGLQPEDVRDTHVGRVITMGTLLAYLDGEEPTA